MVKEKNVVGARPTSDPDHQRPFFISFLFFDKDKIKGEVSRM
jgi:hypothetical protein